MKRMLRTYTLPLFLFFGTLAGCTKDAEPIRSGDEDDRPVTLFVVAPASRGGSSTDPNAVEGDNEIIDFRVMVFGYGGGKLVENEYAEDIWNADDTQKPTQIEVNTGVYDFLFIANEKAEAATSDLHTRLEAYVKGGNHTLADVLKEYFPQEAFNASRAIPMTALYRNVAVEADNTLAYTEEGTARQITNAIWPVNVHRLGIRLDLKLKTDSEELKEYIHRLTIRVPKKVYLINDRNAGTYSHPNNALSEATAEISIASGGTNGTFISVGGGNYEWTLPRIILPENTFNPATEESLALRVGAHFHEGISPLYGSVKYAESDHTAPRNHIYKLTGTVREVIRFDGTVGAWGESHSPEVDLTDPIRRLEPESNCYVVAPNTNPIGVPVSLLKNPRLSNYIQYEILSSETVYEGFSEMYLLRADVLWSDTEGNGRGVGAGSAVRAVRFVNKGTLAKSYILVTPGDVEGNAVVMLYKDMDSSGKYEEDTDIIGYSWHIWVSRDKDAILSGVEGAHGTTGQTLFWMDRNLGAKYNYYNADDEAGVMGLLYQYGRKDPFPAATEFADRALPGGTLADGRPVYGVQKISSTMGTSSISESIMSPSQFYLSTDWFGGSQSNNVWLDPTAIDSDSKSIFDPCPHGWCIPRDPPSPWDDNSMWGSEPHGYSNAMYGGYYPVVWARTGIKLSSHFSGNWCLELTTEMSTSSAPCLSFLDTGAAPGLGSASKGIGMSIRCVKQQ